MTCRTKSLPVWLAAALFATSALVSGCDSPRPKAKANKAKAPSRRRPPRRHATPPPRPKIKHKTLELSDQDFAESPANRDPFRSYLAEFQRPGERRQIVMQRRVLLKRYGLDELKLVAVVTGGVRAQAMFRDPKGLGVTVKRGDYVSKSAGRVKQILPGRVVVEIKEQYEGGQKLADRVIELHAKGMNRP